MQLLTQLADHGVFIPFKLMFGEKSPIPIVEVSIDSSLSPEKEWAIGAALAPLRWEGVLLISVSTLTAQPFINLIS